LIGLIFLARQIFFQKVVKVRHKAHYGKS